MTSVNEVPAEVPLAPTENQGGNVGKGRRGGRNPAEEKVGTKEGLVEASRETMGTLWEPQSHWHSKETRPVWTSIFSVSRRNCGHKVVLRNNWEIIISFLQDMSQPHRHWHYFWQPDDPPPSPNRKKSKLIKGTNEELKIVIAIFGEDVKLYVKRRNVLKDNMRKLYSTVWGQCRNPMRITLGAVTNYASINKTKDSATLSQGDQRDIL